MFETSTANQYKCIQTQNQHSLTQNYKKRKKNNVNAGENDLCKTKENGLHTRYTIRRMYTYAHAYKAKAQWCHFEYVEKRNVWVKTAAHNMVFRLCV